MGLNVDALMEYLPAAIKSNMSEEMGTLALSLILCELTAPPRYALTIVAAPKVAERVRIPPSPFACTVSSTPQVHEVTHTKRIAPHHSLRSALG